MEFKSSIHSTLEKVHRRSSTIRYNLTNNGTQTEETPENSLAPEVTQVSRAGEKIQTFEIDPHEIPFINLESVNIEGKGGSSRNLEELGNETPKTTKEASQGKELEPDLVIKKSSSISKLMKAKLRNKLVKRGQRRRNNSQSDMMSGRLQGDGKRYNKIFSLNDTAEGSMEIK